MPTLQDDKINLTYDIAVAAIVLATILPLIALIVAIVALRKASGAGGVNSFVYGNGSSAAGKGVAADQAMRYGVPPAGPPDSGLELQGRTI